MKAFYLAAALILTSKLFKFLSCLFYLCKKLNNLPVYDLIKILWDCPKQVKEQQNISISVKISEHQGHVWWHDFVANGPTRHMQI